MTHCCIARPDPNSPLRHDKAIAVPAHDAPGDQTIQVLGHHGPFGNEKVPGAARYGMFSVDNPRPGDLFEGFGTVRQEGEEFFFPKEIITRYFLSLKTKPFVILTGISGTGMMARCGASLRASCTAKAIVFEVRTGKGCPWSTAMGVMIGYNVVSKKRFTNFC